MARTLDERRNRTPPRRRYPGYESSGLLSTPQAERRGVNFPSLGGGLGGARRSSSASDLAGMEGQAERRSGGARVEDLLGVADGAAPSPDGVTPPRPASASELSDLSAAAPVFTSSAEADDEATPREGDRARLMTRPRGGSHE